MNRQRAYELAWLALTAFAIPLTGQAQETGTEAAASRVRPLVIEEVIVTSQKREEGLQSTPVAVSVFTESAISAKGIEDIAEIADFAPNIVFDTTSPISGLSSGAVVFIRGIGNTDFSLTTDPGVGIYVDGVYVSRSAGGVLDVLDIERIEVLRGPQGTLFGRNTIGGAISITSRKPAKETLGKLELIGGNLARLHTRASFDIPLTDKLRTTFAISSKNRDGYVDRVLLDDELGDEDKLAFRGTAIFEPTEDLDFQVSFDRSQIDEQSAASTAAGFTAGAGTIGYALATFTDTLTNMGANAAIAEGLADLGQYVRDGDDDVTFGTSESGTTLDINGVSLIGRYQIRNSELKYTLALRETEGEFFRDADNSPHAITETLNPDYEHDQVSHELQLTGTAFDDRLTYVTGLYRLDEEGTDNVLVRVFLPVSDPASPPGGPPIFIAGVPAGINNYAQVDNSSEAAYLQLDWELTDIFSVTGGVRHTRDKKEYIYTQYIGRDINGTPFPEGTPGFPGAVNENGVFTPGLMPLVGNGSGAVNDSFSKTTFKFGVDAKLADGTLLYYSYSQGFKSGGFVLRYVAAVDSPRSFQPETIDTHEIGVKWQGLEDRLRVNAAAFIADYEDVQVTFFDSLGGPVTANSGAVDIKGLELELTALLTDYLILDATYGHIDADYSEINPIAGLSLTIDESAKLVNTPKNSFNIGVEYRLPLRANELSVRVNYSFKDDIFNDSQNSPFLFQESYDTWNASVQYTMADSVDLVAFVENLTDERYIESGDSNFGLGFHEANYNRPREYGVTFRYRY